MTPTMTREAALELLCKYNKEPFHLLHALTVEGVEATDANVKNSTYKISRPFLIFWHEENMNEVATAFVEFIMSAEGQAIVAEKAIPVAE